MLWDKESPQLSVANSNHQTTETVGEKLLVFVETMRSTCLQAKGTSHKQRFKLLYSTPLPKKNIYKSEIFLLYGKKTAVGL